MPRKGDIKFVPSESNKGPGGMPVDLIPIDVKRELEEVFIMLTDAGSGRMHVEYDTKEEVAEFRRQAIAYTTNRPADVNVIRALFVDTDGNPVQIPGDTEGETIDYPNAVALAEKITKGGPLKFRVSPVKGQADTAIDFRIMEVPPPDADTAAINAAADKVKDAADNAQDDAQDAADKPAQDADKPAPAKATGRRK